MKKSLQASLLAIVVSIGVGARLAISGWLYPIGLASALLFGISHFIVHFYAMNHFADTRRGSVLKIAVSHLAFLGLFLFQFDFDDSATYSVLGYVLRIESEWLTRNGFLLIGLSLVVYLLAAVSLLRGAKSEGGKERNIKYLLPAALTALILPTFVIAGIYWEKDVQRTKALEAIGGFNAVRRALKAPEAVEVLKIRASRKWLLRFPEKILGLPNVRLVDLNGQRISSIPDDIARLKNLEVLNLVDCHIKAIPASICDCSKLKELRVGGYLKSLPACLKTMQSLRHLTIQSNTANELMEELRDFKYLETCHFYLKKGVLDRKQLRQIMEETGLKHRK